MKVQRGDVVCREDWLPAPSDEGITMTMVNLPLEDTKLQFLELEAKELGLSVAEVIQLGINEYIARRREFRKVADHVLTKNADLYRRLAQ